MYILHIAFFRRDPMKKLFLQFCVQISAIYWKGYSFSTVRKAIHGSSFSGNH